MAFAGKFTPVFAITAALALAACEDGRGMNPFRNLSGDAAERAARTSEATVVERDVEAPDVFQFQGSGLWDGRPSLGGVWVAHPDVEDPQRVTIRNLDNGRFIIGALFRRERENPGPALQVSSDAAVELGLPAGTPTQMSVIALIREQVEVEPDIVEPLPAAGGDIQAVSLDDPVASMAAAAIDDADKPDTAPVPRPGSAPAASIAAAPAPAPAPAAPAAALEKPFVQIGIFSVEANANQTADLLRNSGVLPTIKTFSSAEGKPYWRVVVGPANSASDRTALLTKVRGLGFRDAYAVTN